jgi:nucleoside-diphosphate-sugar epimerase
MANIMSDLIIGYGYCGQRLAKKLIENGKHVIAVCRDNNKLSSNPLLELIHQDITQALPRFTNIDTLYYFVPPPRIGEHDETLKHFLQNNNIQFNKLIYFVSSGVYGNYAGAKVDEQSTCHIKNDRQKRRLDAEMQCSDYATSRGIDCALLRIAGIYGPHRIPLQAVTEQTAVIAANQAPLINHVYVDDLINCALKLSKVQKGIDVYNIADGKPLPMGQLQQRLAKLLQHPLAAEIDFDEAYLQASPFKREFMNSSKMLCIDKIIETTSHTFLELEQGLNKALTANNK